MLAIFTVIVILVFFVCWIPLSLMFAAVASMFSK